MDVWRVAQMCSFLMACIHPVHIPSNCSYRWYRLLKTLELQTVRVPEGKGSFSSILTCWGCVYSTCLAAGLSGNNTLKFNLLSQITPQGFLKRFSWSPRNSSVMFVVSSVAFLFVNNTWLTINISNYLGAWNIYFYSDDLLVSLLLFVSILHTSEMFIHRQKKLTLEPIMMQIIVTGLSKLMVQTATGKKRNIFPIIHLVIASDNTITPFHWW